MVRGCIGAALLIVGVGAHAVGATPVRLALDWTSYVAYHAPLLVAEQQGYFKKEGLDVTFQLTRGSKDGALAVGTGQADMGWVDLSTAMYSILSKVPIKAVATVQQKNATGLIVLASSTIRKPVDLRGRRIGSTPGGSDSTVLPAFLAANGLRESDLTIVNLPSSGKLASLMAGKVDAVSGQGWYFGSAVDATGKQSRTLLYADFGINLLDHGFIASDSFIGADKPTITHFLRAYQKGLQYTIANPAAACKLVVDKAGVGLTQDLCERQLKRWLTLLSDDASAKQRWGWNDPDVWNKTLGFLEKYGGAPKADSVKGMYTDDFLP